MYYVKHMFALLLLAGACFGLPRYRSREVCSSSYVCVPESECLDTSGTKNWWELINERSGVSTCGHSTIPGVCCANPRENPITSQYPVASQCGVRNSKSSFDVDERSHSTIAYNEAQFGEFPWQAMIFFRNDTFKCGASLIGDRWLVTAAHYVNGFRPNDLKIRLGEWQVNRVDEPKPSVDMDVAAITIHPQFNPKSARNDIAVLQLRGPVAFQYHINSICLPKPGQTFWGQRCISTGWGKDAFDGQYVHIMKKVHLPTIEHQQCQNLLRRTRLGRYFRLDDSFMCAGGEGNKDSCKGDGGGPLACQDPVTGQYILAGITAWGIGCGTKDVPGVYADVQNLLPFIQGVMKPAFDVDERVQSNIIF